jgi:hypothetical protein
MFSLHCLILGKFFIIFVTVDNKLIMQNEMEALVYSGQVIEFVAVANEMCSFLEQSSGFSRPDFVDKTRKILPLLYYKAALLPRTGPVLDEGTEKFVSEEDWHAIHDAILTRLGRFNDYPEVFDPVIKDTEDLVGGSIAENLADIYQDLRDFVMLYRMGTIELMNDALWECTQHFEQGWGQKLLNALRALHNLIHGNEDLGEEDDKEREDQKGDDFPQRDTDNWIFTKRQKKWDEEEN